MTAVLKPGSKLTGVLLGIAVLVLIAGGVWMGRESRRENPQLPTGAAIPQRIVSTSPSTTETLFALGVGDHVVGVSDFCNYPPEVQKLPRIGGYHDTNYEAILSLKPDLVVIRGENSTYREAFEKLGVKTLSVRQDTIVNILDSLQTLGRACGVADRSQELRKQIEMRRERLQSRTLKLPRPRVMLVAEHSLTSNRIESAYVAGRDGFFSDLIEIAGGVNTFSDVAIGFPVISVEGILKNNPEVIIDLVPPRSFQTRSRGQILADWAALSEVSAVQRKQIYILDNDFAFVPGPRFMETAEKLARCIHPEEPWD